MSLNGPLSRQLLNDIKSLFREPSIRVWLDRGDDYTDFVDELAEEESFDPAVVRFRGSYLEVMLQLAEHGNEVTPGRVLIHLPDHDKERVEASPMLEMYRAGRRYQKSLDTLIREAAQGRVTPEDIDTYLDEGDITFAGADAWLTTIDDGDRGELATYLVGLRGVRLVDELFGENSGLFDRIKDDDERGLAVLKQHLHKLTGLNDRFLAFYPGGTGVENKEALAEAFAAYLMCVEYVYDLNRSPYTAELRPLEKLAIPLRESCRNMVVELRDRHPDRYETLADHLESHLEDELAHIEPQDLGSIDTMRGEEARILKAAISAVKEGSWDKALEWAEERQASPSFWMQRDPKRAYEWSLVRDIALLGKALEKFKRPLEGVRSLDGAVDVYRADAYRVDQLHRQLEQQRAKFLSPSLNHFGDLLSAANAARQRYRHWADQLARDFSDLCEREGFLPPASLQQRFIFRDIVEPLFKEENVRVAVFLLDALRYEMAAELYERFKKLNPKTQLTARLAELPTITPVGMNALAPVVDGSILNLAGGGDFKGFKTGQYSVRTPDDRVRAMAMRTVEAPGQRGRKAGGYTLQEVVEREPENLRRGYGGKADLLVVHGREIDSAGESGAGPASFETWLTQIMTAWRQLEGLGFNRFVFLSDHGFLLRDETTREEKLDDALEFQGASRRHALREKRLTSSDLTSVSFSALGYAGAEGHLVLPKDTRVFQTTGGSSSFVHGGGSLQERVIPVLIVGQPTAGQVSLGRHTIEVNTVNNGRAGIQLKVSVKPARDSQSVIGFSGQRIFEIGLRVLNGDDVKLTLLSVEQAEISNQVLQLKRGVEATVALELEGPRDDKVRLELYPMPGTAGEIEKIQTADFFPVAGTSQVREDIDAQETSSDSEQAWKSEFSNGKVADVFGHIDKHGAIKEDELIHHLGSARAARRFAFKFESYLPLIPFNVRIESAASGKRYVKD